jgi:uncharacterized protein YegP (UPF0339 family)
VAKFEVYEGARGEHRFGLKPGNGEIIATGEGYSRKDGAHRDCEAVKATAAEAEIEDR